MQDPCWVVDVVVLVECAETSGVMGVIMSSPDCGNVVAATSWKVADNKEYPHRAKFGNTTVIEDLSSDRPFIKFPRIVTIVLLVLTRPSAKSSVNL